MEHVRAAMLRETGSLPEEYFFFLEETDWCRRVRRAGWRVVHLPSVVATHVSGGSSKRRGPVKTRIEYHRSLYHFLRVNRGASWMVMVLCARLLKCVVARSQQVVRLDRELLAPPESAVVRRLVAAGEGATATAEEVRKLFPRAIAAARGRG